MMVARSIAKQLESASWIRRMFEEGARLKAERGEDNVFDFTLGNPDVEPPPRVIETLRRIAAENRPRSHAYMPNAGFPPVREIIARRLAAETGLAFTLDHIFMTVGSAGAANTILKAVLDPGDEVIVPMPCFSEYPFYILNHSGVMVPVETTEDFLPDPEAIARAITPRTKALLLNSPNNPTGRLYPAELLREIGEALERAPQPVIVVSDEPYKRLIFDNRRFAPVAAGIRRTAICDSWSKAQAIPGERIGYLALSPRIEDTAALFGACAFAHRVLGFVNAPAIWQWVEAEAGDEAVDVAPYQAKRDLLCAALRRMGYEVKPPDATFYLFQKTPLADDIAFVRLLKEEGVLAVPGAGFGRGGYMRLSLTVPAAQIERSLGAFERAFERARRLPCV